jgi:hypothetical protein
MLHADVCSYRIACNRGHTSTWRDSYAESCSVAKGGPLLKCKTRETKRSCCWCKMKEWRWFDLIFFFFKSRATTQSKMFYMKNPSLRKKIWKKRKILMQLCNSFSTGHALLFLLSLLREKKIAAHLFASSIICLYNIRRSRDDLLLLLPFFYWPFLSYTQ